MILTYRMDNTVRFIVKKTKCLYCNNYINTSNIYITKKSVQN